MAPSHPLSFLAFSVQWGFPFNPLKVKRLAGDLRAGMDPFKKGNIYLQSGFRLRK